MMFVGCKKDYQTVTLGVELEGSPANSKVVIDENYNPVILDGDTVNVNGTKYPVTVNGSRYEVAVAAASDGYYYAAYPASLFNGIAATGFTGTTQQDIHLSRWQVYAQNNGVQDVQLPSGAVISNDGTKKLKFYNFCSLLEVEWTNTSSDAYDIIGIEVTVPGVGLYGDGKATLDEANSQIVLNDISNNRVNLDITEANRETVAGNGTSRKYYVVLPQFSNKQVTVSIQTMKHSQSTADDQKLKTVTFYTANNVSLVRNKIVPLHVSATPSEDNDLTGYFSVRGDGQGNDTYKVVFSRGNLQHVGTNTHNTGTWKFADRQYDFFGASNIATGAINLTNTVDLFTWSNSDAGLFGMTTYDYWNDLNDFVSSTCVFQDWGYYKTISGDNPQTWFTLSAAEWYYLLHDRVNGQGESLFGKAKITGINDMVATYSGSAQDVAYGFILLPDDWTDEDIPSGLSFTPNSSSDTTTHNEYSVSEWARMEAAGAVFLPAAGYGERWGAHSVGSEVMDAYEAGQYWSSTMRSGYGESGFLAFEYRRYIWVLKSYGIDYNNGALDAGYDQYWWYMRSVRLVKPAPGYTDPDGRSTVNQ